MRIRRRAARPGNARGVSAAGERTGTGGNRCAAPLLFVRGRCA